MATNTTDVTLYRDLNYRGQTSTTPLMITGIVAIKNVIKLYLMSNLGDYGRNLTKGGPLVSIIGKQITDLNGEEIKDAITKALSIYTNIVVIDIVVTRATNKWQISIMFSDTYNKFTTSTSLTLQ